MLISFELWVLKFGQILVCLMKNISTFFWFNAAEDWKLVPDPFIISLKWQYMASLAIFSSWHSPFLIVPYSSFQKNQTLQSWHNWLLSNWSRLLNWKDLELSPNPLNCSKDSWKLLLLLISIN